MSNQLTPFELQLRGYGLTTMQIIYRLPDHKSLLQTFIWQEYDIAPDYPKMYAFLEFWENEIEGPLHSVQYVHTKLIGSSEFRRINGEIILN